MDQQDPNNQSIQQIQQGQQVQQGSLRDQVSEPQAPISVPVGGAERAPASVTPIEVPTPVSPENMIENGPEFASAPDVSSSVGQVGVVGHQDPKIHPDLKGEVEEVESVYKPTWQNMQEAEAVKKQSKPDDGIYGLATEFIKNIQKKISGSNQPAEA